MMEEPDLVVTLGILVLSAYQDIRTGTIAVIPALLVLIAGFLTVPGRESWMECLFALVPGSLMLLLTLMTNGRIGAGDGLVLLACGAWNPAEDIWCMLMMALLLGGGFSCFLLATGKERKSAFPFLPFLLAGFTVSLVFRFVGTGSLREFYM